MASLREIGSMTSSSHCVSITGITNCGDAKVPFPT